MASPLDAIEVTSDNVNYNTDLFLKIRGVRPSAYCFENITFFLVTILTISDLVTDVWVVVQFGLQHHIVYLAVGIMSLLMCHFGTATMYAIQMKTETSYSLWRLYGCLLLNFPCHAGITAHRLNFNCRNCASCFEPSDNNDSLMFSSSQRLEMNWKFSKIKLVESMLQCVPQLLINLLHMQNYTEQVSLIQIISGALSFVSLTVGVATHEKARREHIRGCPITFVSFVSIFTYETFLLGARILAINLFIFIYGAWAAAILAPHFAVILILFFYLHRSMWPIPYYKICLHSVYGIIAYFPIQGEYRPDSEIIMCHVLYITENIVMACLPYGISPTTDIPARLLPGSGAYLTIFLVIVCGTVIGSTFVVIHSCFLDSSYNTLPSQRMSWCLGRLCCPGNHLDDIDRNLNDPSLTLGVSLFVNENAEDNTRTCRLRQQRAHTDSSYHATPTGAGPPLYRTVPSDGNMTPPGLDDSPTSSPKRSMPVSSKTGSMIGISGKLVITPDEASRPCVMEGEDDSDNDMVQDSDKTPLQP